MNYGNLSKTISRTEFSFKDGKYKSLVKTDQLDVFFYVATDFKGDIVYDSYRSDVGQKLNTYNRLYGQYEEFVEDKLKNMKKLDFSLASFIVEPEDFTSLEINKIYKVGEIPFKKEISLYIYDEKTLDRIIFYLAEVDRVFEDDEIDLVSIYLEGDGNSGESFSLLGIDKTLLDENIRSLWFKSNGN